MNMLLIDLFCSFQAPDFVADDAEVGGARSPLHHHITRGAPSLVRDVRWHTTGQRAARSPLPAAAVAKAAAVGPVTLSSIQTHAHRVGSGPVVLKNKRTMFIPKFTYDGAGPDVYFLVGKGAKITDKGATKVPVAGQTKITKGYGGEDLTLTLPGALTFNDIDWLSVYCIEYQENFGDIRFPKNLNLPSA